MILNTQTDSYWNEVAGALKGGRGQALWRAHADSVNNTLVARWLRGTQCECLLKTDLFDEACGDGLYILLSSRAHLIVGMDISTQVLRLARSHHPDLRIIGADTRCLPYAEGTFDVIISNSTLDHFKTHDQIIAGLHELHRVLKVGGRLIITLDNPANPLITLRNALPFRLLHSIGILPYYVGATFSLHHLCFHMREMDFEVKERSAVMHCPRILGVALARIIGRFATPAIRKRFLRLLIDFEKFEHWPTRYLTGHFIAVQAVKN